MLKLPMTMIQWVLAIPHAVAYADPVNSTSPLPMSYDEVSIPSSSTQVEATK